MATSRLDTYRHYVDYTLEDLQNDGMSPRQALINHMRAQDALLARMETAYIFRVELQGISAPRVWREIRVLSNITFRQFHKVLQIAFGWEDTRDYEFRVEAQNPGRAGGHRLVLSIQEQDLLDFLEDNGCEKGPYLSSSTRLPRVYGENGLMADNVRVIYEYHLCNGWEYTIELLGEEAQDPYEGMFANGVKTGQQSFCIDGEGGPCRDEFVQTHAWSNAMGHASRKETRDPWYWDIITVNRRLDHMWVNMNPNANRRLVNELREIPEWLAKGRESLQASEERLAQLHTNA